MRKTVEELPFKTDAKNRTYIISRLKDKKIQYIDQLVEYDTTDKLLMIPGIGYKTLFILINTMKDAGIDVVINTDSQLLEQSKSVYIRRKYTKRYEKWDSIEDGTPLKRLNMPIEFKKKIINILKKRNIIYIEQLKGKTEDDLLRIKGLGYGCLVVLNKALEEYEFQISMLTPNISTEKKEEVVDSSTESSRVSVKRLNIDDEYNKTRIVNSLGRKGIYFVDQLNGLTSENLVKIRGIGYKSIMTLKEVVKPYGIDIPIIESRKFKQLKRASIVADAKNPYIDQENKKLQ